MNFGFRRGSSWLSIWDKLDKICRNARSRKFQLDCGTTKRDDFRFMFLHQEFHGSGDVSTRRGRKHSSVPVVKVQIFCETSLVIPINSKGGKINEMISFLPSPQSYNSHALIHEHFAMHLLASFWIHTLIQPRPLFLVVCSRHAWRSPGLDAV